MLRPASVLSLLPLVAFAYAQPQGYASRQQVIRAGVVVLSGDRPASGFAQPGAPYAFWNLERSTLKPPGWTFSNPFGASTLAGDRFTRWSSIDNTAVNGQSLTKSNAPYWEVDLKDLNDDQIAQYDVLLVSPRYSLQFNSREREGLRRFMDRGGILWVDLGQIAANQVDQVNSLPFSFGVKTGNATAFMRGDTTQGLLTRPNTFNYYDFGLLNTPVGGPQSLVRSDASTSFPGLRNDYLTFQKILTQNNEATIAYVRVGDGFQVVTTRSLGYKLNATSRNAANDRVAAQDGALSRSGIASAKFAVNLASLGSEFRQQGGGSRRAGSTVIDIPAPLLNRFKGINRDGTAANNEEFNAPVVYKGVAYVVQGRRLVAYDTDPGQDLDGFNGPDDGMVDYGNSFGADKIWESTDLYGPGLSSPVVVEAADPDSGANTDYVYVADRSGRLYGFSALNETSTGQIRVPAGRVRPLIGPIDPPGGRAEYGTGTANAPTVHNGLIYMADIQGNKGRVWVVRASTGRVIASDNPFKIGGSGAANEIPPFSSGPTIGSIPIADNSGGTDLVLYAPTASTGSGANAAAGLISLWIGTQGESPVQEVEAVPGGVLVTTRAQQQGGPPIWCPTAPTERQWAPRITYVNRDTGDPMDAATLATYVTGPAIDSSGGQLTFPGTKPPTQWQARVSYNLDWGGDPNNLQGIQRGTLNFPDTDNQQVVYGNIAMSGRGTIYAIVGPRSSSLFGGSLYAFREEGRGTFRCLMRYDLYGEHKQIVNGTPQTIRELYADNDLLRFLIPGTSADPSLARLTGLRFTSSPVVRGDQVFAGATATKRINVGGIVPFASTVLMAFRAEPLGVEIPVRGDAIPDGSSIIQKDMARSQDKTQPDQESQFQQGQYTYDSARGVIRIDNLMTTTKGPIQSSLNTSAPIILRKPDGGDTILEPDRQGGRFSPLLWYTVLNGFNTSSTSGRYRPAGLFVSGSTLYTAGDSILPPLLRGEYTGGIPPTEGLLTALDAQIPSADASLSPDPQRPWQNQLTQFIGTGPGSFRGSDHFRWPMLRGISSGEDYGYRLNQTTLGREFNTAYGVVGGDGTIFSWSDRGVAAFRRSDLVVADEGRIGVYDAGGSPVFTTNASVTSGANGEGSVGSLRPIVRPTRAYAVGGQQLLVADPATNRIARIAADGVEVRSIDRFITDRKYVPRG
ncbi:hypothetical protein EON81_19160, partial [bacterium]